MTTKDLRDTLTEKRALYRESLARADVAKAHIEEVLADIDMKLIDKLKDSCNIDLSVLKTIDLEKAKVDQDYLTSIQLQLSTGVNQLREFIERSLNV